MSHPLSILLVDDDALEIRAMTRALKQSELPPSVAVAHDGQEALDYLAKNPRPDLILLDVRMPRLDGLGFLRERFADEKLRQIPTVVFSTSVLASDVDTAYAFGAAGFFRKPIEPQEASATVRTVLEYWTRSQLSSDARARYRPQP